MDFPIEMTPGEIRDSFKSIECQIMDWADDTAYSLNDLADSYRAGFLNILNIEQWAEKSGEPISEGTPLGDLIKAIRGNRVEPFIGKRIGQYIQSVSISEDVNIMSANSNRYRYKLSVDEQTLQESKVYKKLAYQIVFLSPELKQLEHKGDYMLSKLWDVLKNEYIVQNESSRGGFRLLPEDQMEEIKNVNDPQQRARLICDFLASMTDGSASRLYKRLFIPDFGSIGDLV